MRCDSYMDRNSKLTGFAQKLRKEQTKEEAKLWYQFLRKYRVRFHRQYVIGNYIADFYCHKAKLVIELDGSQHYEPVAAKKDENRTKELETRGLTVLRIPNNAITENFSGVCEYIDYLVLNTEQ